MSGNSVVTLELLTVRFTIRCSFAGQPLPKNRDPFLVYANNELDLSDIDVYGFDYDYTLACYKEPLHHLIYKMGQQILVTKNKACDKDNC